MTILCDPEDRRLRRDRSPQRALIMRGKPARLINVDGARCEHLPEQPLVRPGQSQGGALADRVDRADRQGKAEQVDCELCHVAAGDAVSGGEAHHGGLQAGTERRVAHSRRELGRRALATTRAAQTVRAMLAPDDRYRRQLGHLVAPEAFRELPLLF